jgi:hypothetical protein
MLALVAAGGVAVGGVINMPGCQTIVPIAVHAAISACIEAIKTLIDAPSDRLPDGYIPCDEVRWQVEGHELRFCVFCDPSVRSEVYIQFGCSGKYYPMRLRRIERPRAAETSNGMSNGISIESIKCQERLLAEVRSTIAPFMSGLSCTMRAPNDRVLPSIDGYGTLDVRIDGVPVPREGDLPVAAGGRIELEGSFDEVAHYAMTCGVLELAFKSDAAHWTVYANPDVSAIAVFRDGELHDARFLFAPTPSGGMGY